MPEEMRKRSSVSRRRVAATAPAPAEGGAPVPEPMNSLCGHSGCANSPTCNVRYVGAVSHIRDHHALHAARGVGHIWAASIITGFAVVLTGVIAFQSAQAKTAAPAANQLTQVMQRLDRLERLMMQTRTACGGVDDEDGLPPAADSGSQDRDILKKKMMMQDDRQAWYTSSTTASTMSPTSTPYSGMNQGTVPPKKKPFPPMPNQPASNAGQGTATGSWIN